MALSRPIGSATAIAMAETSIVPATSGSTPKCWLAKSGVHSVPVRNSSDRNLAQKADGLDREHER